MCYQTKLADKRTSCDTIPIKSRYKAAEEERRVIKLDKVDIAFIIIVIVLVVLLIASLIIGKELEQENKRLREKENEKLTDYFMKI